MRHDEGVNLYPVFCFLVSVPAYLTLHSPRHNLPAVSKVLFSLSSLFLSVDYAFGLPTLPKNTCSKIIWSCVCCHTRAQTLNFSGGLSTYPRYCWQIISTRAWIVKHQHILQIENMKSTTKFMLVLLLLQNCVIAWGLNKLATDWTYH